MAFKLGNDAGFYWIDGYEDISSEDILSGFGITAETKTAQAEELIRSALADGNEIPCDEIFRTAERKQISRRTVNEAKKEYPRDRHQEGRRKMDVVYPQMKIATLQECSYCIVE